MDINRLNALLRELIDARREYEKTRVAKTEAYKQKKHLEARVHEALTELRMKSYRVDLGEGYGEHRFNPNSTIYARVIDKQAAIAALEAEGRSGEEIITTKVREQQANELVREKLEHGEDLPEGLDWYETTFVTVSKL